MAQTSTTLSGSKDHVSDVTGTDISFTSSGGVYTISSTSTTLTGDGKFSSSRSSYCNRNDKQ